MDGIEVNGEDGNAADHGTRTRRLWTAEEKRRIVREAGKPGVVRQQVAQRHGVHVSVLNRWRTELRSAVSGAKKSARRARLLPVRVSKTRASRAASRLVQATMAITAGDMIDVAFTTGQRVTVRGVVDGEVLRAVLQELSRC